MRPVPIAVHVATLVLLVNMCAALLDAPGAIVLPLFLLGPVLVVWMVVQVLRDKEVPTRELKAGAHWGYQDRPDLEPGS